MAADVLGEAHHADVDTVGQRREAERRGPGVVEHGGDVAGARDEREGRDVGEFHRQAAGGFQQRHFGARAQCGREGGGVGGVEPAGFDADLLQMRLGEGAAGFVGVVGHHQHVAGAEQRGEHPGDGGDARGIEHGARRPRLQRGECLGQRPLRGPAAPAIVERAIGVGRAGAQARHVRIEVRGGAPHRRADHPAGLAGGAGPFRGAAGIDDLGGGFLRFVRGAHRRGMGWRPAEVKPVRGPRRSG